MRWNKVVRGGMRRCGCLTWRLLVCRSSSSWRSRRPDADDRRGTLWKDRGGGEGRGREGLGGGEGGGRVRV